MSAIKKQKIEQAGHSIELWQTDSLFMIKKGYVDLFVVGLDEAGKAITKRHVLLRAYAGQAFLGHNYISMPQSQKVGIIGVFSQNALIEELPVAQYNLQTLLSQKEPDAVAKAVTEFFLHLQENTLLELQINADIRPISNTLNLIVMYQTLLEQWFFKIHQEQDKQKSRIQSSQMASAKGFQSSIKSIFQHLARVKAQVRGKRADDKNPLVSTLYILLDYFNIKLKLPQEALTEAEGDIATSLGIMAGYSGFRYRKITLKENWYEYESMPILAFLKENNAPIALLPYRERHKFLAINPQTGERTPVDKAFAENIQREAYTFYRPLPEKITHWKQFISFGLFKAKPDIIKLIVISTITAILGLATPIATGIIFDDIIPNAEMNGLYMLVIGLFVLSLAMGAFEILKSIAFLRIQTKADFSLQTALWDRLLKLPTKFFQQYTVGDLVERALGINAIYEILSGVTVAATLGVVFSFVNFFVMFYYSWQLSVGALIYTMIIVGILIFTTKKMIKYELKMRNIGGFISGLSFQILNGIHKIHASGGEHKAFSVWASRYAQQIDVGLQVENISVIIGVILSLLSMVASLFTYTAVAYFLPEMSIGQFVGFNVAFGQFLGAVMSLNSTFTSIISIKPIYERFEPIVKTEPEITLNKPIAPKLKGLLEINNLSFRYEKDGPLILKNVSITAEPGEFIAFVGTSGSGKTTLMRCLLGFEMPHQGTICYDGYDISHFDIRSIRKQMGVVLQSDRLMPGTILTNITGTTSKFKQKNAWEALEKAGMAEDIRAFPMKLETVLADGMSTISGGQKQRLLIARALVKNPPIILFDEATSSLDNKTQDHISKSLENLHCTRIIIAHRLSTIKNADRIYVFKEGEVIESGNYETLRQQKGYFYELIKRQDL